MYYVRFYTNPPKPTRNTESPTQNSAQTRDQVQQKSRSWVYKFTIHLISYNLEIGLFDGTAVYVHHAVIARG
ncbi:hypothetical protein BDV27DRAFT_149844 [Aspergillus caelatus]|uniref:Uncharacterized protein n=2 Tax=Aspergillus subgen. Circumdati TaxID=2720871 RepID=A0A5N6ZNC4_9EURO|nr:uncharacterized protein BDV27DRAFT_149844 [Aspergillus caelatus]KAE8359122.1 hypothetical protein BDV27DRAFT_149844 [Aspergillus caelatus]KAE8412969.1 hypothetical protein BDV36DRAFT_287394 [Aspergillus pseudocaelatus]